MEKLLQPLKQEGFSEEVWKDLTNPVDSEQDLLSDGEHRPSPKHSPNARGTKRTADGERKKSWGDAYGMIDEDDHEDFHAGKVQSPPAAMPLDARGDTTEDDSEDFKPNMYHPFRHY
jgi:hypothetical protein